jgi:TonB family C-terminal domain
MAILAKNKKYPRASQRRGETGVVKVAFSLDANGELVSASVRESSGYRRLDKAALKAVKRSRFPAPPSDLSKNELSFTIPILFEQK